jgi:hypothetical protein
MAGKGHLHVKAELIPADIHLQPHCRAQLRQTAFRAVPF